MPKQKIRKEMLEKREALSIEEAERKSRIIIEKLKNDKDYIRAERVMFYMSRGKEVMTEDIIKDAFKSKKVIVPKVTDKGLICCEITDSTKMSYSCFGILEPDKEVTCDVSKLDLVVVPGVAFDKQNHRIGYGKGYYDSLLKHAKCRKIGLAYDFQIVEKIPADEWDEKLDKVISD
jgi:5-formyltetrahydrofolate cyclo-ligase